VFDESPKSEFEGFSYISNLEYFSGIRANGKLEDNFNFLTPDHYEQWLAFHHDSPMQIFIKNLQGLPNFKVWLNKEKHMSLGWYIPRKNSKLIKLGKGSSKSHLGQGLFRHLRSCFVHDMADSCSFYFSQSDSGKVKATDSGFSHALLLFKDQAHVKKKGSSKGHDH
jgi:hypothetical protein